MNSYVICYIGKDLILIIKWLILNFWEEREGEKFEFFC